MDYLRVASSVGTRRDRAVHEDLTLVRDFADRKLGWCRKKGF
jgi:hypothetical protein